MRIALVVERFDPRRGGLEEWSHQYVAELVRRRHEVHVVGNIINGQYIAGLMDISQQSLNGGTGVISCIDYLTGEFISLRGGRR